MSWDLVFDVLRNTFLITGLVIVMMMMIEYINVQSSGRWFASLQKSKPRQVLLGAILGVIPGCMGGFAAVSLFSHGLISYGALVATMICSSGDEAFVMLAMIPKEAMILFAALFVLSIACGLIVDKVHKKKLVHIDCSQQFEVHEEDHLQHSKLPSIFRLSSYKALLKPSKEKITIIVGLALFIAAIFSGVLEHEHDHGHDHGVSENHAVVESAEAHSHHAGHEALESHQSHETHEHSELHGTAFEEEEEHMHGGINLLDERWMNILFACLSIIVLLFTATADEHFIREHIWAHVIKKHFMQIFLWTFGALAVIQVGLQFINIEPWLNERSNLFIVILVAALIGMIPESGPHMIFIALFASGMVPFSVLLTSSISQDGHMSLPLLASSKKTFVRAKLLNAFIALAVGCILMLFGL